MAAAELQSGVCESLALIVVVYLANVSTSDFIQNLGTGTVVDLKSGLSAVFFTYPM